MVKRKLMAIPKHEWATIGRMAVTSAFRSYDLATLERVWQALFHQLSGALDHKGGNDFPIAHSGTGGAQNRGELLWQVAVNRRSLTQAKAMLRGAVWG